MYIGELAKLSGATPKAIRHYESLGLLVKVKRVGVYRVYTDTEVQQVKLIKQAQVMGFRLSEILPALIGNQSGPDWQQLIVQIDQKCRQTKEEIERLQQIDLQLQQIKQEIQSCLQRQ